MPVEEVHTAVRPIHWAALGSDRLTGDELLHAQILSNATKYAMTTWWQDNFGDQADADCFSLGGLTEHFVRPVAAQAFALATALALDLYDPELTGVSRELALTRCCRLIRSVARSHRTNSTPGWGAGWQDAYWAAFDATAAHLLWEHLPEQNRRDVCLMVEYEADRFLSYQVPYWKDRDGVTIFEGDTKSEENSWNSMLLQQAIAMLPGHPNVARWSEKNIELLVSALARPSDLTNDGVVNGRPVAEWLNGTNIEEDGRLINHHIVHPDYMMAVVHQLFAPTVATLSGDPTPVGAVHGIRVVWNHLQLRHYDPADGWDQPGGTIYVDGQSAPYYPQGTDWGTSRRMNLAGLDAMIAAWGFDDETPRDGRYWLRMHGRDALAMQERHADLHSYDASDRDTYPGREEWVSCHAAWAVLSLWVAKNGNVSWSNAAPDQLIGTPAFD